MSRTSESRRLAIRLVDSLKREGHDCSIEIDEHGMPQIYVVHEVTPPARQITFEIELGDFAAPSGGIKL